MDNNGKKYRRSVFSIVCYALAVLMLFYIVYTTGSTIAQINQYYAQYDMQAQPTEYVTYVIQSIIEPLINVVVFFMLGYILDEVRRNNPAYYISDEELEEAKIAKKEAKIAKKAAAGEAAAAKAGNIITTEQSVEADFARSLDEELSKDAEKRAPRKRSNNSQKRSGEGKPKQGGQSNQNNQSEQNNQNNQNNQNKKKAEGSNPNRENKGGNKGSKDGSKKGANPEAKKNTDNSGKSNNSGSKSGSSNRRRSSKKPAADKAVTEAK